MPRSGIIQRQYPRVEVLRGYDPNEPRTKTQANPVFSGVTILSGQVIYAYWNSTTSQHEWKLGWVAGALPYIALADDQDEDVLEAGNLPALSVAGDFEIQTAFYTTGTFNVDAPLTPDGTTGSLKVATLGGTAGSQPIVGHVTRNHGPLDITGTNSSCVNTLVVSFQTAWNAANGS